MNILVTAFMPFNNELNNYSKLVLDKLSNNVYKLTLPVVHYKSFELVKDFIKDKDIKTIILLGEARSYKEIAFEVIAVNDISNKKDENGFIKESRYIIENKPDGLFSTLDYNLFEESFKKNNTNFKRSLSAGNYVCNSLFYLLRLHTIENNLNIDVGFIHLPILNESELNKVVISLDDYINNIVKNKSK